MSKRTEEDAGEERVTGKSKPMMNLVSPYSVRDPNVIASTASERPGKTKSERQNVPLPVIGASSSNYLEWNIDDKWSPQVWKSGGMLGTRTVRPVDDKFVIDDDDMDSDTATEWNLSLKSRSFLNRVNDRLRKILGHYLQSTGKILHGNSYLWSMMKKSSVYRMQRYMYSQILCYVLER